MSKGPRNPYNIAKTATKTAKLVKEIKDTDATDVGLVAAGMVLAPLTGGIGPLLGLGLAGLRRKFKKAKKILDD